MFTESAKECNRAGIIVGILMTSRANDLRDTLLLYEEIKLMMTNAQVQGWRMFIVIITTHQNSCFL